MTKRIVSCFSTGDPGAIQITQMYWARGNDGIWEHTVKEIADQFECSSASVSKIAKESAVAFILDVRCPTCAKPHTATSRTDLLHILTASPSTCFDCLLSMRKVEQRRLAESQKIQQERQNAVWLRETGHETSFDYRELDYLDASYAFVILISSELDERSGEVELFDSSSFSPDATELQRVINRLHDIGMLSFGKKTKPDAFLPGDDERSYRYYPARISWRFAVPASGGSYGKIVPELAEIVNMRTQDIGYSDAVKTLWWHIGEAEAMKYLKKQFDAYCLAVPEGDKLQEAIHHVLTNFSIPCMRNLIWRLAKDSAAYASRRDVHVKKAMNSVPGSLIRMCDRALADGWDIKPYVLKWDTEESLLTTALFDRLIGSGVAGFRVTTGEGIEALVQTKVDD